MKRLTTDTPSGNFETALNFVYGKDGWAYIRHDGEHEDVRLTDWAKCQCKLQGCDEVWTETPEEIDQQLSDCMMDSPICPVAMAYCFASQAVHLRSRLAAYEDTGLMPEDIDALQKREQSLAELLVNVSGGCAVSYDRLAELANAEKAGQLVVLPPNDPLTLDELREMDGEPVWIAKMDGSGGVWMLVDAEYELCREAHGEMAVFENCGKTWLAYRRRPEEGA